MRPSSATTEPWGDSRSGGTALVFLALALNVLPPLEIMFKAVANRPFDVIISDTITIAIPLVVGMGARSPWPPDRDMVATSHGSVPQLSLVCRTKNWAQRRCTSPTICPTPQL